MSDHKSQIGSAYSGYAGSTTVSYDTTAKGVSTAPEIIAALRELAIEREAFDELMDRVEERLIPVSTPRAVSAPQSAGQNPEPTRSPIAHDIVLATNKFRALRLRLAAAIDHLEI